MENVKVSELRLLFQKKIKIVLSDSGYFACLFVCFIGRGSSAQRLLPSLHSGITLDYAQGTTCRAGV